MRTVPTYRSRTITKKTYRTSVPYFFAKIETYRTNVPYRTAILGQDILAIDFAAHRKENYGSIEKTNQQFIFDHKERTIGRIDQLAKVEIPSCENRESQRAVPVAIGVAEARMEKLEPRMVYFYSVLRRGVKY